MVAGAAVAKVLLAQGRQALLFGHRVDVGADDEGHQVKEGHPGALGQELLGKRQADGRRDPADAHHLPEADPHRGAHLVEGARTGDERHSRQVDGVLDGGDLQRATLERGKPILRRCHLPAGC